MAGGMTGARTRLFIGSVHDDATDTLSEFDAIVSGTWVQVEEVTGLSAFGLTFQEVTTETFDNEVTEKYKGTANAGNLTVTLNMAPGKAGQTALEAALASQDAFDFKIEYPDKPAGATSKPTRHFFAARVMGFTYNPSSPNAMITNEVTLSITTKPIKGAKVTGA